MIRDAGEQKSWKVKMSFVQLNRRLAVTNEFSPRGFLLSRVSFAARVSKPTEQLNSSLIDRVSREKQNFLLLIFIEVKQQLFVNKLKSLMRILKKSFRKFLKAS